MDKKKCIRVHASWKPTRLEPIVLWPTWLSPAPAVWKRIAQHFYFETFPISNQTKWWRLRYMKPLISPKSNQIRFFCFCLKVSKKTVVLIWICYQVILFRGESADASCTELVGHKIDRLNRKPFFYLNHHPLVHFLSDRSQQKVNLHHSLFQLLRFQMSIEKG